MNHKKTALLPSIIVSATFASGLLVSTAAMAEEQGFYLSTDIGVSNSSVKRFGRDLSETECDLVTAQVEQCDYSRSNRNFVGNAGIGYKVGDNFAFEVNYYDLVNDKSSLSTTASGLVGDEVWTVDAEQTLDVRLRGIGIRAVANIPLSERWSALLNFGLGHFKHERDEWAQLHWRHNSQPDPEVVVRQTETSIVPFAGIGTQYQFNDQIALRAMINSYALSGDQGASTPFSGRSLTTATIGIVYRF